MAALPPASQENERIARGGPLGVMISVLVFSTLLCIVASLVLSARSRTRTHATASVAAVRPEPEVSGVRMQLLKQPGAGQQLKAQQQNALRSYGWVDKERGIVRIPIDVAMDLDLQEQH
jgi:hypothetical protein